MYRKILLVSLISHIFCFSALNESLYYTKYMTLLFSLCLLHLILRFVYFPSYSLFLDKHMICSTIHTLNADLQSSSPNVTSSSVTLELTESFYFDENINLFIITKNR